LFLEACDRLATQGVQEIEVFGGLQERLVIVLAVNVDEEATDLGKLSLSDRTIVNLVLAPARREDLTREQDGLVVTQLGLFERMVTRGTGFDCKRGFDPGPIGSLANVLCAHTRSRRRRHRSDYDRLSRPRLAGKYRETGAGKSIVIGAMTAA